MAHARSAHGTRHIPVGALNGTNIMSRGRGWVASGFLQSYWSSVKA